MREKHAAAFDIRLVIGLLFAIYGVVLTIIGLVATSPKDIARSGGLNINLWSGIGMVVCAFLLGSWAWWRPVVLPNQPPGKDSPRKN